MTFTETKRHIDNARDVLVGKVPDPKGQIDQITNALVYKFMDDIDEQSAAIGGKRYYFTGGYEQYSWQNLMNPKLGAQARIELYRDALENMSKNPNLPELFRDIFRNAYLPFNDARTLTLFLKEIDYFNYENSELTGHAYEYLLSIMGSQGDAGQFRTPRHIIDFIVEATNPTKDDSVLDPACGTAGFLISAYKHVMSQHNDGEDITGVAEQNAIPLTTDEKKKIYSNYYGFDIDDNMVKMAKVNMYLHSFPDPRIINHDTLSSEDYWSSKYDVIFANPPFMTPKGGIQPHQKFGIESNRAELLFVDYIASHLKPTGRAGVIVPEGIIFQSGKSYKELRKNLVENYLHAVVSLPGGVFNPYSGVKTSILIFDKELAAQRDEVLFIKIESDGRSLGAQRKEVDQNDIPEALEAIRSWRQGEKTDSKLVHWVDREKIAESGDYNLTGDRYKEVKIKENQEWQTVPLKEIITLETGSRQKGGGLASGIPSIGGEQIHENGSIKFDNMKYISKEHFEQMNKGVLRKGDVLVVKDGATTGKVGYWHYNRESAVNEHVYIFRAHKEKILPYYLYSIAKSDDFSAILKRYIKGIIGGISKEVLDIKIPLPPLEIQKEIVEEIGSYQKVIDGARQVIENYKPTIKIKPEWERVQAGDLFEKVTKQWHPKDTDAADFNFYVGLENVESKTGRIKLNTNNNDTVPGSSKIWFMDGDILYGKLRPNLNKVAHASLGNSICSTDFLVLRPKNPSKTDSKVYAQLFRQDEFNNKIMQGLSGSQLPRVKADYFMKIEIPDIPKSEQEQINEQIVKDQEVIKSNKKLIEICDQKIQDKITEIWGE